MITVESTSFLFYFKVRATSTTTTRMLFFSLLIYLRMCCIYCIYIYIYIYTSRSHFWFFFGCFRLKHRSTRTTQKRRRGATIVARRPSVSFTISFNAFGLIIAQPTRVETSEMGALSTDFVKGNSRVRAATTEHSAAHRSTPSCRWCRRHKRCQ